jgi:hypothetical protein
MSSDSVVIGEYKSHPVYLTQSENQYWISFGTLSHRYWIGALEKILRDKPDYIFTTQDNIEIVPNEIRELLAQTRKLIDVL